MSQETLNFPHVRDFLDYIEAEAMTGVHEQTHQGEPHRDYVNAIKAFIGKFEVYIPVVVASPTLSPTRVQKMQKGFLRDWQAHQHAIQTLRPLFDLVLAVAEKQSQEEQARLYRAAFPHGTDAAQS